MAVAVEMKHITKKFSNIIANNNVDLTINSGEIHCLLGENGAGKTTLMNILFGLYQPDEGKIYVNGKEEQIKNPRNALDLHIGMVHQHFMLINRMTILENIILGDENCGFFLNMEKSTHIVKELSEKFQLHLELNAKIDEISVGLKQRVEILKILYRGADIIILDEPTAVLTPPEVEELFLILRELKKNGKTIVFITHKLNETMEVADRITVLRDGKNIKTLCKNETNMEELARLMIGREMNLSIDKKDKTPGPTTLSIEDLSIGNKTQKTINLEIHSGEILGVAGVEGNGQLELEEIIMGIRKINNGKIYLNGNDITKWKTKKRKLLGIGYIPSDRHKRAMLGNFNIYENILLGHHFHEPFCRHGLIQQKTLKEFTNNLITNFNVKVSSGIQKIKWLSGGNQQKVVIGREISFNPVFILAAQPTRGLDIGATEFIHNMLLGLRDKGTAILLISADLNEVKQLSDRIAVLYEGDIKSIKPAKEYKDEELGMLMAGKDVQMFDE